MITVLFAVVGFYFIDHVIMEEKEPMPVPRNWKQGAV